MNTHSLLQPRLPANRAFVVQFQVTAPGSPEAVHGRVEHMVSGRATHFASWSELEAFIEQVLATVERRPP